MSDPGPYREGRVHVCEDMCPTCVFRPGNLMCLAPGRLKALVEANVTNGGALQCHETLPHAIGERRPSAVCRGFYDAAGARVQALDLAQCLGLIEFDRWTD
jgi:hypothetical protein